MYDIDLLFPIWLRWKRSADWLEVKRSTGMKSSTIEYRLMRESGNATVDGNRAQEPNQVLLDLDHAICKVGQVFPNHLRALEIYYSRKNSFRAVRVEMNISSHQSRKLVLQGRDYIQGALCVL